MVYPSTRKLDPSPGPLVDGWHVVSYPGAPWCLLSLAGLLSAGAFSLCWAGVASHDSSLGALASLLLLLVAGTAWLFFLSRERFKHRDDTLLSMPIWGRRQEYRISELRSLGMESIRGTEIIPPQGESFYISKAMRGGMHLIELITGKKDWLHPEPDDSEWLRY